MGFIFLLWTALLFWLYLEIRITDTFLAFVQPEFNRMRVWDAVVFAFLRYRVLLTNGKSVCGRGKHELEESEKGERNANQGEN